MNPSIPAGAPAGDVIETALSKRGAQVALALELNWPESKVSEVKTKLQRDGVLLLKALGLKIVPEDLEEYDSHSVHTMVEAFKIAVRGLTAEAMKRPEA